MGALDTNGSKETIMYRQVVGGLVVGLLLGVAPVMAQDYKLYTIAYPGGTSTDALAMNDKTTFVGKSYHKDGWTIPFYVQKGKYGPLPFSGRLVTATGLNNDGAMSCNTWNGIDAAHSCVLSKGKLQIVQVPAECHRQQAWGISDAGHVVGGCDRQLFGSTDEPFKWVGWVSYQGEAVMIDPPGSSHTTCWGVNSAGQVACSYFPDYYDEEKGVRSIIYHEGILTEIAIEGVRNVYVAGINDQGVIAGSYQIQDGGGSLRGFTLQGDTLTTVNINPEGSTHIRGINNKNQLLGLTWPANGDPPYSFHAIPLAPQSVAQK
jgi:uncharacterized membrane protein